ncbi:hydrolase [Lithospermum erythrorhizon]|uniref:Hydrolase n=1 Tax=Lithospermum erythrorhizon TaxID=34254 RepID=A0AAV3PZ49_LITER
MLCLWRPERVKGLVNLSVPYTPRDPRTKPVDKWRKLYGDDHYICRFQEPGDIEAELSPIGIKTVMQKFLTYSSPHPFHFPKGKGFGDSSATPLDLPSWLPEDDLEYYSKKFEKTGLTGGINFYRALNLNWELTAPWSGAQVKVPAKFITGELDLVYHTPGTKEYIHNGGFKKFVPLLEDIVVIEGAAHFVKQERPEEFNLHIYDFIKKF